MSVGRDKPRRGGRRRLARPSRLLALAARAARGRPVGSTSRARSSPATPFVYLAAGERLNAGPRPVFPLMRLATGRWTSHPPYWTGAAHVPAADRRRLPRRSRCSGDAGAYAWWVLQLISFATAAGPCSAGGCRSTSRSRCSCCSIPTVYVSGSAASTRCCCCGLILSLALVHPRPEPAAGAIGARDDRGEAHPGAGRLVAAAGAGTLGKAVAAAIVTGIVAALGISVLGAGLDTPPGVPRAAPRRLLGRDEPAVLGGMAGFIGVPLEVARYLSPLAIAIGLAWRWRSCGIGPRLAFGGGWCWR